MLRLISLLFIFLSVVSCGQTRYMNKAKVDTISPNTLDVIQFTDTIKVTGTVEATTSITTTNGNFILPATSATVGQIKQGSETLLHTYNDGGGQNLFFGTNAGNYTMTGNANVGIGISSLHENTSGYNNVAIGASSLQFNTEGYFNVGMGWRPLWKVTTGIGNIGIGVNAGYSLITGDSNIFIGLDAGYLETGSNKLYIGNNNNESNKTLIYGDLAKDSLVINGDLTYGDTFYKDAIISALSLTGGAQAPTLQTVTGGIKGIGFNFQTANDIVYGQVELNHDYKLATDIEVHIHYSITTSPASGSDTVVMAFEYSWADIDEFIPTSDTITVKIPTYYASGGGYHRMYEISDAITGAGGDDLGSIILFRLERLQNSSSDTYENWFILHDIDFHYQIDAPGSDDEDTK